MNTTTLEPRLVCVICHGDMHLSHDPTVRMAEVHTFFAAHEDHGGELAVELIIPRVAPPDTDY